MAGGSARLMFLVVVALVLAPQASAAAPPNDDFAEAQAIAGLVGSAAGTNVDATAEANEPPHAGDGPYHSVWYRWTAPAAGSVTFDVCDSDFDTLLAVYTGPALGSLTDVASNDDSLDDGCGYLASQVTFTAVSGTTYSIAVDGASGETGSFELHWTPPRPTNIALPVVTGHVEEGETLTATNGEWQSGLPPSFSYQWQRCGRLDYPAENVALGKPATVSEFEPEHPPEDALDGDFYSYWGAGNWPPQRFAVDLGAPYPLNRVRLAITQLPDGFTVHRILVKGPQPGDAYQVLANFSGNTVDEQVLQWNAGSWLDGIQFVQVETLASPSWVGWREIEAFTNCSDLPGATGTTYAISHADIGYMLRAVVTATTAAGSTAAVSARTDVVPYIVPQNIAPPEVSGRARLGATLRALSGQWRGTTPLLFTFQWQRCGDPASGSCSDIADETDTEYSVRTADIGSSLRVVVTVTNEGGSASAASSTTPRVRPDCVVPRLVGKRLAVAKRLLVRGHCRLGRVKRVHSRRVKAGRVISQKPRSGARLPEGTRVRVVVSRGHT